MTGNNRSPIIGKSIRYSYRTGIWYGNRCGILPIIFLNYGCFVSNGNFVTKGRDNVRTILVYLVRMVS